VGGLESNVLADRAGSDGIRWAAGVGAGAGLVVGTLATVVFLVGSSTSLDEVLLVAVSSGGIAAVTVGAVWYVGVERDPETSLDGGRRPVAVGGAAGILAPLVFAPVGEIVAALTGVVEPAAPVASGAFLLGLVNGGVGALLAVGWLTVPAGILLASGAGVLRRRSLEGV
jgi:hypothetical protein